MAINVFGAVYIGSYETTLKIFQISQKKGIKEIDFIKSRLDLGKDAYEKDAIGYELVEKLCDILAEFKMIMQGYRVDSFEVYASAVMRDISNELFVLDQVLRRTGINIKVVSNSEVRFMSYKSFSDTETFSEIIQTSAAVVDIGGSGIQITLFKDGLLTTTQYIELGPMRLNALLYDSGHTEKMYRLRLEEYINKRLEVFKALYLKDGIDYVVFTNDYGANLIKKMDKTGQNETHYKAEKFKKVMEKFQKKSLTEITEELSISNDKDPLIIPTLMLFKCLATMLKAEEVWIPGVSINDGIAHDYAVRKKLIRQIHDFDADIISAAKTLSEHYMSFTPHIEALTMLSMKIFDTLKKIHGLGKRERLLLQVATILHDCGKYISLSSSPENTYNIILSSEIIGLTHKEREIVALTVLYNTLQLDEYEELAGQIDKDDYVVVAKLSAILRVANALDQSHRQKFNDINISLKDRKFVITVETMEDISLEQSLFEAKTSYFENVFSIKPVLKEKRRYQ